MTRRTMKARLTAVSASAYAAVLRMTPAERRAATRALDKLTDTNCAFHLFQMRQALATFIACARSYPRAPRRKRDEREGGK